MNTRRLLTLTLTAASACLTIAASDVNRGYAVRMWAPDDARYTVPALVSFDLNAPEAISDECSLEGHYFRAGVCVNRDYYLIDSDDGMVPYRILKVDLDSKQVTTLASYNALDDAAGLIYQDMTYDATTSTIYALAFDLGSGTVTDDGQDIDIPLALFTFDSTDCSVERIGILGDYNFVALAAAPSGTLYGINDAGELWTIDKVNGKIGTKVADSGITPSSIQSAEFNAYDGKLYWAGFYASSLSDGTAVPNSFLGCFSLADNSATFERISALPHNQELVALYIDPTAYDSQAPRPVEQLTVTPASAGALSATIAWSNPSLTIGGDNITAALDIDIYRNGNKVFTASSQAAGTAGEYVDAVETSGLYTYKVVARNSYGESRSTTATEVFIGRDTPSQVTDITAAASGDGYSIALSWQAPAAGAHGGWFDSSSLRYTVTRYPDEYTVATDIAATTLTDTDITDIAGYYYLITTSNADGTGLSATSPTVIVGNALDVPYACDFGTDEAARLWTIIDADADGQTFYRETTKANGQWFMKYFPEKLIDPEASASDYLISPPIKLYAGHHYLLKYCVRTLGQLFPIDYKVTIGTDDTAAAQTTVLDAKTHFTNDGYWSNMQLPVSVTADNAYYFAISTCNLSPVHITDIEVVELFDTDMAANTITGSMVAEVGKTSTYTVALSNKGYDSINGYKLQLIDSNDNILAEQTYSESIEPLTDVATTITWTPQTQGSIDIRARIAAANDGYAANDVSAAVTVEVLSGEGEWVDFSQNNRLSGFTPYDFRDACSMTQTIYPRAAINASAGKIYAITYHYSLYDNKAAVPFATRIYLANVADDSFTTNAAIDKGAFTLVYEGELNVLPGFGETVAVLDTPFDYDGTCNLCIMAEQTTGTPRTGLYFYAMQDDSEGALPVMATYYGSTPFDYSQELSFYAITASMRLYMTKDGTYVTDAEITDADAPVEIYTPAGIKLSSEHNLSPGIYIYRQGSRISKRVVR
ncbi:MAG: choice-of-anchor J domain-containing protein [Muribaculaceae bacterium]